MASSDSDKVKCPICLECFKQPKALSCGHSLCEKCVNNISQRKDGEKGLYPTIVLCPECRKETYVPPEGLPTNFVLKRLVNDLPSFVVSDPVSMEQKTSEKNCFNCNQTCNVNDAWVCFKCDKEGNNIFCPKCILDQHKKHNTKKYMEWVDEQREQMTKIAEGFQQIIDQDLPSFVKTAHDEDEAAEKLATVLQAFAAGCVSLVEDIKQGTKSPASVKRLIEAKKMISDTVCKAEKAQKGLTKELTVALEKILAQNNDEIVCLSEKEELKAVLRRKPGGCWKCGKIGCNSKSCQLGVEVIDYDMSEPMVEEAKKVAINAVKSKPTENDISQQMSTHFSEKYGGMWHCASRGSGAEFLGLWFFSAQHIAMRVGQVKITLFNTVSAKMDTKDNKDTITVNE